MKSLRFIFLAVSLLASAQAQQPADAAYAFAGEGDFIVNLNVFPNPSATGNFTVEFSTLSNAPVSLRVFNLIGREVYAELVPAQGAQYRRNFSLEGLPKGVYMLEVSTGDKKLTRRISFI